MRPFKCVEIHIETCDRICIVQHQHRLLYNHIAQFTHTNTRLILTHMLISARTSWVQQWAHSEFVGTTEPFSAARLHGRECRCQCAMRSHHFGLPVKIAAMHMRELNGFFSIYLLLAFEYKTPRKIVEVVISWKNQLLTIFRVFTISEKNNHSIFALDLCLLVTSLVSHTACTYTNAIICWTVCMPVLPFRSLHTFAANWAMRACWRVRVCACVVCVFADNLCVCVVAFASNRLVHVHTHRYDPIHRE